MEQKGITQDILTADLVSENHQSRFGGDYDK